MMVPVQSPQPRMVMVQEPSVQVMQSVLSIDDVNSGGWTNVGAPQVVWQGEEEKQIMDANEELLKVARTPQLTFAGAGGAGGGAGAGGGMIKSGGATGKNTSGDPTIVVSRPSLSRSCLRMPHFAQAVCNFESTSADGACMYTSTSSRATRSSLRRQFTNHQTTDTHTSSPALFPPPTCAMSVPAACPSAAGRVMSLRARVRARLALCDCVPRSCWGARSRCPHM